MKKNISKKSILISFSIMMLIFSNSTIAAQSNDDFTLKYYVDEFGDPTDNAFLFNMVEGVFSNSATTNSRLSVAILISKGEIGLGLFEYGDNLVKWSSYTNYMVKMKLPNGEVVEDRIILDKEVNRFFLSEAFYWKKDSLVIFDGISPAKFLIYDKEIKSNSYLFSIVFPSMDYVIDKLGEKPLWYIE